MIKIKSAEEIEQMKKAGALSKMALRRVGAMVRPGVSTFELDQLAEQKYAPMSHIEQGPDGQPAAVIIDEPFDRAWRRVGVALDRAGFEVTDRDRSQGLFMINYLDPDYEQQKKSEQGFFTNLFSKTKAVDPVPYRIRLSIDGEKTRVTVTGEDGRADTTGVAPRIINLIGEQTR